MVPVWPSGRTGTFFCGWERWESWEYWENCGQWEGWEYFPAFLFVVSDFFCRFAKQTLNYYNLKRYVWHKAYDGVGFEMQALPGLRGAVALGLWLHTLRG